MSEAQRFSIIRSIPHVEVTYMTTKRAQDIEVRLCGVLLGSCCRIFKRGKEVNRLYYITEEGITRSNP
jgi:hypothetical protein